MILLLGGSGYIGSALRRQMDRDGTPYVNVRRSTCNYYDRGQLDSLISEMRPVFLINAAGFSGFPNIDACELNKTECLVANAALPGIIREVCERRHLSWGHVSSGCIYTGNGADSCGFRECDAPNFTFRTNNCSFYSGCKALGEEILQGAENCYIWRLRIPFNHIDSPKNYLSKLMRYERLLDVRNSLTHLDDFAGACFQCWENGIEFGTYNLTNSGSITTREVVEMIREAGLCKKQFDFFDSEAEFMQVAAIAPRSTCVLDNSKVQLAGVRLTHVHEAIERSLADWKWDVAPNAGPGDRESVSRMVATKV